METSIYLTKLIGLSLALFALIGFIKPGIIKDAMRDIGKNKLTELWFGFVGIVIGLAIILKHNIWVSDWPLVITLVGWASLIKGILFFLAPEWLMGFGKKIYKTDNQIRVVMFIAFLVGLLVATKVGGM
jgi:hypothetical protein